MPSDRTAVAHATRLIDEMLAAQSRIAETWTDGMLMTSQRRKDEAVRDAARDGLLQMIGSAP